MPGSAGGGHSGGGGFSGGGFSGGGGFGGGGFSGRSGGHIGGFGVPVGGFVGRRRYGRNPGCLGGGCLFPVVVYIIAVVFVMGLVGTVFTNVFDGTPSSSYEEVSSIISSTRVREKLDESLCTPIDTYYEDTVGAVADATQDYSLINGMKEFYEKTGVQPYLIITDTLGENYSEDDYDGVNNFLTDKYINLFGTDEGHFILLYKEKSGGYYETWYITGNDAMDVIDDEAAEILLDYIDSNYYSASSYAQMLSLSFTEAAERIMGGVTESENSVAPIINSIKSNKTFSVSIVGVFALISLAIIVAAVLVIRKKYKDTDDNKPVGNTYSDAPYSHNPNIYGSSQGNTGGVKTAVKCPYCGATTNPTQDGRCEFCSSKIQS